ncbi:MAG: class I SAM-dependent methyltransferase [Candidatus Methanoperedens sp.]|nr:class I SAM-dependent methyltransferase [Candidatus Methanoperedens sp.]
MHLEKQKDYGFSELRVSDTNKLPAWDKFRLTKISEIFNTCDRIIDFGNSSRALSELLSNSLLDKEKIFVDINKCYNPDVVADICNLDVFEDNSIDGIICAAVLEHVYNPDKAVSELFRILKPGGKMFVYVPWIFMYHAPHTGEYSDYFRFSCDGVRYLFKDFSKVEICLIRGYYDTIFNLIPYFMKGSRFQKLFGGIIRKLDRYDERYTSGFNIYIIK